MKTLKRSDIIKALKVEKLKPGSFFHHKSEYNVTLKTCSVCAIGAIIRQKFKSKLPTLDETYPYLAKVLTQHYYMAEDNLQLELSKQNYLGALSIKFERMDGLTDLYKKDGTLNAKGKRELIEWVEENIPATISVKVD